MSPERGGSRRRNPHPSDPTNGPGESRIELVRHSPDQWALTDGETGVIVAPPEAFVEARH